MSKTFHLTIKIPDQEILNEKVESLTVSTEELGIMQILPHHASLSGVIFFSPLKVKLSDREEDFIAKRGILMISNEKNQTTLLCVSCEKRKEISYQTANEYLKFIEEKLKQGSDLSQYQLTHLEKEKLAVEMTLKEIQN